MIYEDHSAQHDVEYCYQITALYPSGESFPSNQFCSMWVLGAPFSLETEAGNGYIELCWSEPVGGGQGGGDTVEDPYIVTGIPFEDSGSTIGFNDDYDEVCPYTGSTSPDVVYSLSTTKQLLLNINTCGEGTNYDTKLYVYQDDISTLHACNDDYCANSSTSWL